MIVRATPEMLPDIAPMISEFHAAANAPGSFCTETWVARWSHFIETEHAFILCYQDEDGVPVGVLGGFLTEDPCDGVLCSHEAFWYVTPEARGVGMQLLDAFMSVSKALGAGRLMMGHTQDLRPEALARIYRRKGFRPIETMYTKELV